jgi:outer membrane receptor protein involved in Fe transport
LRYRLSALLAAAAVASAPPARAQIDAPAAQASPSQASAPSKAKAAPAKPARGKTVEGVTVTGASQNGFRSSIDRRSYGVANDLAATTGSISDALKNVPSVEVDVNGNVSLRGDPNVTILVDGKPSALFRGPGAAQALQALPADQIERVEVITNPSAQFSPEASAGIINLITKQNRRAGRSASFRVNLGGAGRRNIGAGVGYNANKLTLSADAAYRIDPQHAVNTDDRASVDPTTGELTTSHGQVSLRGPLSILTLHAGGDYDLDPKTRIGGEVRYNDFKWNPDSLQAFTALAPDGATVQAFNQTGRLAQDRENSSAQMNFRRKFDGDSHDLAMTLSTERVLEHLGTSFTDVNTAPVSPDLFRDTENRNTLRQTQFKADYQRPMPAEGRLKAGLDIRTDQNDYDAVATRGTSAADAAPDPSQTDLFRYRQTVSGAYVTYEQPFGDWTVLAGLRVEDVNLDLNQVTSRLASGQDYVRGYPSLHLAYKISDTQQLTLSYSERVQRPNPTDLNPFRFTDVIFAHQGNPNLRPQDTQSYEAGWQLKDNGTFYLATLYYRQNEHGVTDIVTDIGGGVLLDSKANLSSSRAAGLELVANGKITKTLSYNVSANLYWNEIDATPLGFANNRSSFAEGGRASLNWQITPNDLFQISGQLAAKKLLPQGFTEPMFLMFLGYRHRFSDALSFVATVQDPTDTYRFRQVLDSPGLHEVTGGRGRIQSGFVGLSWSFGAAQKRPQTFDFSGGGL